MKPEMNTKLTLDYKHGSGQLGRREDVLYAALHGSGGAPARWGAVGGM